jgi:general secretion pathway protein D
MLQVTQEVNQATSEASGLSGVDAPVISTRSVQTQLLIKDRQTVILGGLTDRQRDVSQGGVPVLSSIPWIGWLFGRTNRRTSETELYLFITPQVIRDDAEAEAVTKPMQERSDRGKP